MKHSDKMNEYIEKTKDYLLSLTPEDLNTKIEECDNEFGRMLVESGFLINYNIEDKNENNNRQQTS